jgi:hypothetical protein
MLSDLQKQKLIDELMYNTLIISFADGTESITEDNIASESMKLKQSICDEDSLKFGGCIASEFTIDIFNTEDRTFDVKNLKDKWINVKLIQTAPTGQYVYPESALYPNNAYPDEIVKDNEFYIFNGYIDSVEKDKNDNNSFTLTAYDVLAKLHSRDATAFLFNALSNKGGVRTLKNILSAVRSKNNNKMINIPISSLSENYLNEKLTNGITVGETEILNPSWLNSNDKITFGEILKDICEMLGVFGFITPSSLTGGVLTFIDPFTSTNTEAYNFYEDFSVVEDVNHYYNGIIYGNCSVDKTSNNKVVNFKPEFMGDTDISQTDYDISDNILAQEEYNVTYTMGYWFNSNMGKRITGWDTDTHSYYPITATVDGRPWANVGDKIEIFKNCTDVNGDYIYETDENGEYELDENGELIILKEKYTTYIMSRTLTGIQALTDEIETKG